MDADDAAVLAEDVRKAYGDVTALDGVSLRVDRGEVFGLIGPNGAGKTTLVRALTGTTGTEGRIRTLGSPPAETDRQRLGLLPQSFSPPGRLTARELLAYYAGLYDDARDPAAVLRDVGLADDADTWYERLSGGQQRRACVGIALVNDPDLLVLDEPTTGIDPVGRRDLWSLLDGLAADGTTVLLTSHSMDEVERLADRVGLLRDGRLVATGTPAALVAEHGGESRLVVGGTGAEAATALERAGYRVAVGADEVVVRGIDARDIGDVAGVLDGDGVDYGSLAWREPSLEDVYLSLTGEAFEGAATPGASAVDGAATADGSATTDGAASGGADSAGDADADRGDAADPEVDA